MHRFAARGSIRPRLIMLSFQNAIHQKSTPTEFPRCNPHKSFDATLRPEFLKEWSDVSHFTLMSKCRQKPSIQHSCNIYQKMPDNSHDMDSVIFEQHQDIHFSTVDLPRAEYQ